MKKLITIFVALIATFAVMAQGTFPVPVGYGGGVEADFRQRVLDSGGTSYPNVAPHIFSEQHSYGLLPVFQMIPAATEDSVLFSQYPTDGTGDFTVVNAGTKFVTNSDGLLERIAANIAAIDYTNGTPTVKLNEDNTNLLERPLSFGHSDWTKSGSTIEGDASTAGSPLSPNTTVNYGAEPYDTFDGASATGFHAISDGSAAMKAGTADEINYADGTMYKIAFTLALASGTAPNYRPALHLGGATITGAAISTSTAGTNTYYFVSEQNATGVVRWENNSTATEYTISDFTITEVTGYPSPSVTYPTDAYLFTATAGDGSIKLTTGLASAAYNNSWYVKRATGTGVVSLVDASDTDIPITVTSGWQRFDANATGTQCGLKLADSGDAVYIAFAQTSAKTYAPTFTYSGTEGATSSMLADAITGGGDAALFASVNASGVLYWEGDLFETTSSSSRYISLGKGVLNNDVAKIRFASSGNIIVYIYAGASAEYSYTKTGVTLTDNHKMAIRWGNGTAEFYLDGVELNSAAITATPTGLNEVKFSRADTVDPFYGNANQVAVYNYLNDAAMILLTTP